MPSSVTSSSLASIFTPLVSSTSADLPASLRYWRRLFSLRIGEPCGVVAGNRDGRHPQVANLSVDFQFHAACFLRLGRMAISRQLNVPRRCTTASSVAMSTGI